MADRPLLELTDITKRFESPGGGADTVVLDGVRLTLEAGDSLAVVGPSGSGKSTLLNIVGTLDRPSSGTVRLDGQDLSGLSETELAAVRNRQIGFVFQLHHLLPQCTVLENVLIPTLATGADHDRRQAADRARSLLDRVGLAERMDYRPGQLSGGERQRVAVVRALINEPKLLLADEPTGSLDAAASENMAELLDGLNRQDGLTLIMVTHSADLARHARRVYRLRDAKLGQEGR